MRSLHPKRIHRDDARTAWEGGPFAQATIFECTSGIGHKKVHRRG